MRLEIQEDDEELAVDEDGKWWEKVEDGYWSKIVLLPSLET